jgi:hypothetical protein
MRRRNEKEHSMDVDLAQASIVVKKGRSLPLRAAPGTRILVLLGCAWITQEGDPRDYIVGSGEEMLVTRPGQTLFTAIEDSAVSLLQAEKVSRPRMPFPARLQEAAHHFVVGLREVIRLTPTQLGDPRE